MKAKNSVQECTQHRQSFSKAGDYNNDSQPFAIFSQRFSRTKANSAFHPF